MPLVILLTVFGGCSKDSVTNDSSKKTPEELYSAAVEDARVAEANEIYAGLDPIVESNTALTWRGVEGDKDVLAVPGPHGTGTTGTWIPR